MIKGFGVLAFALYLLLCFQIGTFGPGVAIWFLSLILISAGIVSSILFFLPPVFESKALLPIQLYAWVNPRALIDSFCEVCDLIRKDGLLSLESARQSIRDPWMQYALKKMSEGFEPKMVLPVIRNEGLKSAALFEQADLYKDRVLNTIPLFGLVASLFHLMGFLQSNEPHLVSASFVPFVISILLQMVLSLWIQRRFDFLSDRAKNYHAVLEEGVAGLGDGISADVLKDRLMARITHA
jgi:chemotaxis protein MotA